MSLPGAILAQFTDSFTIALAGATDAYGEAAPSSTVVVRGRVSVARQIANRTDGDERMETTKLLLADVAGFDGNARVTLPDGSTRGVRSWRRLKWPGSMGFHLEVVV